MPDNISQSDNPVNVFGGFRVVAKTEDHAPFRNLPGWKFDEGLWQSSDHANSLFTLPLASDLDLTRVPDSYFKSGVGSASAIELDEINFVDEGFILGWTPGVLSGDYWIHRHPDYLHSSESILVIPANHITFSYTPNTDPGVIDPNSVRSLVDLEFTPSYTTPIMVKYLERDGNLAIKQYQSFTQVSKFTGVASNGIEQDGDDYNNTDTTKSEFRIVKNDSDPKLNLPIILDENATVVGSTLRISLDDSPINSWRVKFSRPDIFKRELPFSLWNEKYADPTQVLAVGDYAIGYQGSSGEGTGVWLWQGATTLPDNLGTISYRPTKPIRLQFNKDVRVPYPLTELTDYIAGADGLTYFIPRFPLLDISSFVDESLIGELVLDTESTKIYVGGVLWTRVESLEDVAEVDDQNVYELNPLWGTVRFGNGGNALYGDTPIFGARPDDTVTAEWTAVPYIRYDKKDSSNIFSDPTEDLDPMTNALKQGFLVLDTRRLLPWKIELTTNSPWERNIMDTVYHGKLLANELVGLGIPPTSEADITILRARVLAYGSPPQGIPNVPVEFISPDGLLSFTQSAAVTDGDGYAYTEAFGKSNFSEFVLKVHLFNSTEEPVLNPTAEDLAAALAFTPLDPIVTSVELVAAWEGAGPAWQKNALVVEEQVDTAVENIYLFVVSTPGANTLEDYDDDPMPPADYLAPYNSTTRDGGLAKVWSAADGAQAIVHPIEVRQISNTQAILVFDRELPAGHLVMGYRVVIDRTSKVVARTVESPILISNQLNYYLTLNETMKGQWKLPNLQGLNADGFHEEDPVAENTDSSRIGTATYISPNDFIVSGFQNEAEIAVTEGVPTMVLLIKGENFPGTSELKPSVFIVKVNSDGAITSLKDITEAATFVDQNTIRIGSLPSQPTGALGEYYIAVSSYSETTAKPFTFVG